MSSIIISERDVSSVRFLRQTGFEIALLFLMHLRLHDVNPFIILSFLRIIYFFSFEISVNQTTFLDSRVQMQDVLKWIIAWCRQVEEFWSYESRKVREKMFQRWRVEQDFSPHYPTTKLYRKCLSLLRKVREFSLRWKFFSKRVLLENSHPVNY